MIDGHRINDPMFDYPPMGEDFPLDIDGVERIEIVKGPGSALWGNNALLGIVNVVPERGAAIDGVTSSLEYGTYDRTKGSIKAGKAFDNGLEVAAMFTGMDSGGVTNLEILGMGNTRYQDEEEAFRGHFLASYKGLSLNFIGSTWRKEDPTGGYETIFDSAFNGTRTRDNHYMTQLRYEQDVLPKIDGKILARATHAVYYYHAIYEYDENEGCCGAIIPYDYHDKTNTQWWGTELQFSLKPHSLIDLTSGFEYQDMYQVKIESYDKFGDYADSDEDFYILAGYIQGQADITKWLRATAGVRLDKYSTLSTEFSPRGALVITPWEGTTLKGLYGQAFRAPSIFETDYMDGDFTGNNNLDPESIETWEVIFDQMLFGNTHLVASLFRYKMDDLITEFENPDDTLSFINAGKVTSRGFELMVQTALQNGIRGHLGFTVLRAEDDAGVWLRNSPKYLGNLALSVPLFSEQLTASAELQAVGRRKTIGDDKLSPAFGSNLALRYEPFDWFEASLGIYNLFDETIRIPSGNQQAGYGTDNLRLRGRSFRFQIRGHF
jgi:iron complex outermembrane receptor protein